MPLDPSAPPSIVTAFNIMVNGLGREPTQADVELILDAIVGNVPEQGWMDVNRDGVVNVFDSITAAQVITFIIAAAPSPTPPPPSPPPPGTPPEPPPIDPDDPAPEPMPTPVVTAGLSGRVVAAVLLGVVVFALANR